MVTDMEETNSRREKEAALIRLVDDDESVRRALSVMLEIEGWQTAAYESAEAFLAADDSARGGCLILDVRMGGLSGLELQDLLAVRSCELPIIFLTGYADIDVAIRSLKCGAADFLLKPADDEKLLAAIEKAVHKDWLARAGLSAAAVKRGAALLSEREREILLLISRGRSDAQIAAVAGISERTVQGHRAKIYRKFDVHTAGELQLLLPDILHAIAE